MSVSSENMPKSSTRPRKLKHEESQTVPKERQKSLKISRKMLKPQEAQRNTRNGSKTFSKIPKTKTRSVSKSPEIIQKGYENQKKNEEIRKVTRHSEIHYESQ